MDLVFSDGLTVRGTTKSLKDRYTPESVEYSVDFAFTQSRGRQALRLLATENPAIPPPVKDTGARLGLTLKRWTYADEAKRGDVFLTMPAGVPLADPSMDSLSVAIFLSPPLQHKRDPAIDRLERALGRGFTRYASECIHVAQSPDGLLEVHLRSEEYGPGIWKLQVDPAMAYLVREGRYYKDGAEKPLVIVANEGCVPEDETFVPTSATCDEDRVRIFIGVRPYLISEASLSVDEPLLAEARAALLPETFPSVCVLLEDGSDHPNRPKHSFERRPGGTLKRVKSANIDLAGLADGILSESDNRILTVKSNPADVATSETNEMTRIQGPPDNPRANPVTRRTLYGVLGIIVLVSSVTYLYLIWFRRTHALL